MANKSFADKLASMPKSKRALLLGVAALPVIGFLVYYVVASSPKKVEDGPKSITIEMADGEMDNYNKSRLQTYQETDLLSRRNDYWDALGDPQFEDEDDIMPSGSSSKGYRPEDLDQSIYSVKEIDDIVSGRRTKQEIDLEHLRRSGANPYGGNQHESIYSGSGGGSPKPMTQAQKDSAYFARIEKTYALAMKYSSQAMGEEEDDDEPVAETPQEEEARRIDLTPASLPEDSFSDDGIITSLVEPSNRDGSVNYSGTAHSKPVKATFLKNETITNGQRVIIRLMQDMTLNDGTVIPANTHITGVCDFSKRLMINVKMLHYNGRMFPTDISVYDNDGMEGIYCPTVESSNKKAKKAKKVAGDAVSAIGSIAGGILTGNPFIGTVARSGLQAATSTINSDGTISVKVTSGYEFYVFQNVKK